MSIFNEEQVEDEFIDEFCQIINERGEPVFEDVWDVFEDDEDDEPWFSDPNDDWNDDQDNDPFDDDSF